MEGAIQVSVICNTYNHELYIREALNGFVMQKTNFAFEVLVHDDASTDNTAAIIREFEEKYPDIIKPIYQTENQYSKKVGITVTYQLPRAMGKYIAMCEGDDYWTDETKLQKQFDALEAHPSVDICAHAADQVDANTKKLLSVIAPRPQKCIIPVEDVIMGEGGFVATNSLMCKKSLYYDLPRFRKNFMLDYTFQIHGALCGGMLYLPDNMAAYRFMAVGSWSSKRANDRSFRQQLLEKKQRMLLELDEDTNYLYNEVIKMRMLTNEFQHFFFERDYKQAFDKKYKPVYMKDGFVGYLKLRIKSIFPALNGITRIFKKRSK
ncbi:MAG: glycosyltransferase [Ruminococcaceae bacterium]|nr:glycosyltransferase [Oscillospiraceae bacterium]